METGTIGAGEGLSILAISPKQKRRRSDRTVHDYGGPERGPPVRSFGGRCVVEPASRNERSPIVDDVAKARRRVRGTTHRERRGFHASSLSPGAALLRLRVDSAWTGLLTGTSSVDNCASVGRPCPRPDRDTPAVIVSALDWTVQATRQRRQSTGRAAPCRISSLYAWPGPPSFWHSAYFPKPPLAGRILRESRRPSGTRTRTGSRSSPEESGRSDTREANSR